MDNKDKTAYRYALGDISKHLREQHGELPSWDNDQWIVSAYQLDCKEVRRLNRQLKVHSINKMGNTNQSKRQKDGKE
jgi:hypothetical protein